MYPIADGARPEAPDCQVTLRSSANLLGMRDLHADSIAHLVRIPGIVIGASTLASRAVHLQVMCRECRTSKGLPIQSGFGGFTLPRYCDSAEAGQRCTGVDPFVILHDKCRFVDTQTIKLQEAPDMVPVGELPRHMLLSADRALCGRVVPGSRIIATGVYSTFTSQKSGKGSASGAVALRTPYLRVVGLEIDAEGAGGRGAARLFSAAEEDEFQRFARTPELYEKFAKSIAPSIFGNEGESQARAARALALTTRRQTSKRRSHVSSSAAARRSCQTACGCAATSTCCCSATRARQSRSCSSSSRRCVPL
jgi:DNA replication licensing factor MCM5